MNDNRHVHDLASPIRGELYATLLRAASDISDIVGMITRSPKVILSPRAREALSALAPHRLSKEEVAVWPGTQLIGGRTSTRHLFKLVPDSLNILLSTADDLFDWVNPELPEDLHFLRSDRSTVLGSVAQDEEAWLELTDRERLALIDTDDLLTRLLPRR